MHPRSPSPDMIASLPSPSQPERHSTYYLPDDSIVFRIGGTLFKVHRYVFERDSRIFRDLFSRVLPSDEYVSLDFAETTSLDFERFLSVLYPLDFDNQFNKSVEEWTSILDLAHKWEFQTIRSLALRSLTPLASPIDKIAIGRKYGHPEWLNDAFVAVCVRDDALTLEEGNRLGVEVIIQVSDARQSLRGPLRAMSDEQRSRLLLDRLKPLVVPDAPEDLPLSEPPSPNMGNIRTPQPKQQPEVEAPRALTIGSAGGFFSKIKLATASNPEVRASSEGNSLLGSAPVRRLVQPSIRSISPPRVVQDAVANRTPPHVRAIPSRREDTSETVAADWEVDLPVPSYPSRSACFSKISVESCETPRAITPRAITPRAITPPFTRPTISAPSPPSPVHASIVKKKKKAPAQSISMVSG